MATRTDPYGLYEDLAYANPLPSDEINRHAAAIRIGLTTLSELLGPGVVNPAELQLSLIGGQLAVGISAAPSGAVTGGLGVKRAVQIDGSLTLTGLTPSTTNYVWLLQAPTDAADPVTQFTSNTTGTPPTDATLVGTVVTDGTAGTAVNNAAVGRVPLPRGIASGPVANRPAAATAGRWWYDPATLILYYDNGAAWVAGAADHTETFIIDVAVPLDSDAGFLCDFSALGSFAGDYLARVDHDQDDAETLISVLDNDRTSTTFRFLVQNSSGATAGTYGTAAQLRLTIRLQGPGWTAGVGGVATLTAFTADLQSAVVFDPGRLATGFYRVKVLPSDGGSITVQVAGGSAQTFEFDDNASVGGGHTAVTIAGSIAATVANLKTAIDGIFSSQIGTAQHATDTDTLDLWMLTPGVGFTLTSSNVVSVATQDNGEERAASSMREFEWPGGGRVITSDDVDRGRVVIRTPLAAIDSYRYRIEVSATNNAELAYTGAKSVSGGVVEFATGGTPLAAGNVLQFSAKGT